MQPVAQRMLSMFVRATGCMYAGYVLLWLKVSESQKVPLDNFSSHGITAYLQEDILCFPCKLRLSIYHTALISSYPGKINLYICEHFLLCTEKPFPNWTNYVLIARKVKTFCYPRELLI